MRPLLLALLVCWVATILACSGPDRQESAGGPPGAKTSSKDGNLARYAHARDLPQLLRDALPAPVRITSVELTPGRAVVVVPAASGGASAPYARYELVGGALSAPTPTSDPGVTLPDGGVVGAFDLDDVDWAAIPGWARNEGLHSGIDVEMGVVRMTIRVGPKGDVEIVGEVGHSSPRGKRPFSWPATR